MREIDEVGLDLRAWCLRCARGAALDPSLWARFEAKGWTIELPAAGRHFSCTECQRADQVLVLPASKPRPSEPEPDDEGPIPEVINRQWTATDAVAAVFHTLRSQNKRRR